MVTTAPDMLSSVNVPLPAPVDRGPTLLSADSHTNIRE